MCSSESIPNACVMPRCSAIFEGVHGDVTREAELSCCCAGPAEPLWRECGLFSCRRRCVKAVTTRDDAVSGYR